MWGGGQAFRANYGAPMPCGAGGGIFPNQLPTFDYQAMKGFTHVDYRGGWNNMIHDQMLMDRIDSIFQRYDFNCSGQLEGNQFVYGYRDLCLMMGVCPPMSYADVWSALLACDGNRDGRISKRELFMLFKRIQGVRSGLMVMPGNGMGNGNGYINGYGNGYIW